MKRSTIIILAIVGVLLLWVVTSYNGLISAKEPINGAWGEVENQYQRRLKLYKNVIETIKGAANFEKKTLENIIRLRSGIPETLKENDAEGLAQANKDFSQIRRSINIQIEAYPNLKAVDGFRDFQTQIEGTENRVSKAIGDWNAGVTAYNTKISKFPKNILAGIFGFTRLKNFKAEEGAKDYDVKDSDFKFD